VTVGEDVSSPNKATMITRLQPLLVLALLLPACKTPCEPSLSADALILLAADECFPDDTSASTRGSTGQASTEGHSTMVQTQTSAPEQTSGSTSDTGATDTEAPTSTTTGNSTGATTDEPTSGNDGSGDTGQVLGCFADACDETHPCGFNMFCKAHPNSGDAMCVFLCTVGPGCAGAAKDASCSEMETPPECLPVLIDGVMHPVCFPSL
jgi:cobalamin biosynthesis Mg chelatase CobN